MGEDYKTTVELQNLYGVSPQAIFDNGRRGKLRGYRHGGHDHFWNAADAEALWAPVPDGYMTIAEMVKIPNMSRQKLLFWIHNDELPFIHRFRRYYVLREAVIARIAPPEWIWAGDIATCGISIYTIRRYVRNGRVRKLKIGQQVYYNRADITMLDEPPEGYVWIQDAAQRLHVHLVTVYQYLKRSGLKTRREHNHSCVPAAFVEQWRAA